MRQQLLASMAKDLGWRLTQVWGRSRSRRKSRSRSRNRRLPQGDTTALKEARVLDRKALKARMRGHEVESLHMKNMDTADGRR